MKETIKLVVKDFIGDTMNTSSWSKLNEQEHESFLKLITLVQRDVDSNLCPLSDDYTKCWVQLTFIYCAFVQGVQLNAQDRFN